MSAEYIQTYNGAEQSATKLDGSNRVEIIPSIIDVELDAVALNLQPGEMLTGIFKRESVGNTFIGDVGVEEIGGHCGAGSTGNNW